MSNRLEDYEGGAKIAQILSKLYMSTKETNRKFNEILSTMRDNNAQIRDITDTLRDGDNKLREVSEKFSENERRLDVIIDNNSELQRQYQEEHKPKTFRSYQLGGKIFRTGFSR